MRGEATKLKHEAFILSGVHIIAQPPSEPREAVTTVSPEELHRDGRDTLFLHDMFMMILRQRQENFSPLPRCGRMCAMSSDYDSFWEILLHPRRSVAELAKQRI